MKTNEYTLSAIAARGLRFVAVCMASVALLSSCKTEINMRDVDMTAQVGMGLVLPVGSVQMTLGDILGSSAIADQIMYDSTGTLVYRNTFEIAKSFHPVDITEKGTNPELKHLHMTDFYPAGNKTFDGARARMTFDVGMKLNHVNDSLNYERLDSAYIKEAEFISIINYRPNYGGTSMMREEWIERIDMILGDQFSREDGKVVTVYDRQHPERYETLKFGEEFKVRVDAFSMSLMRDKNIVGDSAARNKNAIDSIHFQIRFQMQIPNGTSLTFDSNSAFEYQMQLGMLKYGAVWGMFQPTNDMRDEDTIRINEIWDGWDALRGLRLPLSDPEIRLNCVTQVAGQMKLTGDYLFVKEDETGEMRYASFNGNRNLNRIFSEEECLSLNSAIGDSVTFHIRFSKDPSEGAIDRLFEIHPDELAYHFAIDFADRVNNPVVRLTDNTDIAIHAQLRLPLSFNEGLNICYKDTAEAQLGVINKDSLLQDVNWVDSIGESHVMLALVGENRLPMAVDGNIIFLDEMGKKMNILDNDSIHFGAPKLNTDGTIAEPGKIDVVLRITDDQLDQISKAKKIVYAVSINDKAVSALQKENPSAKLYPLQLKKDSSLKLRVALAASLEAVMDIKNLLKED